MRKKAIQLGDSVSAPVNPLSKFEDWLATANAQLPSEEATAMTLATVDNKNNTPHSRVVLLKQLDSRGFVFYTNYRSSKARQLIDNPHAALCFFWPKLARQVRIEGQIKPVSAVQSDAYFQSRERLSQIGAWASKQSEPCEPGELEQRMEEFTRKFADGPVPRPDFWGGLRLTPRAIEFWEGAIHRLHQRDRYDFADGAWPDRWLHTRLFP